MSYNKRWSTNIIHLASLHKESTSYSITPMLEEFCKGEQQATKENRATNKLGNFLLPHGPSLWNCVICANFSPILKDNI